MSGFLQQPLLELISITLPSVWFALHTKATFFSTHVAWVLLPTLSGLVL